MIKGFCRTNLDDYRKEIWPTSFVAVPREGDWVEAQSGAILKVCKVTHKTNQDKNLRQAALSIGEPYIEIELHRVF